MARATIVGPIAPRPARVGDRRPRRREAVHTRSAATVRWPRRGAPRLRRWPWRRRHASQATRPALVSTSSTLAAVTTSRLLVSVPSRGCGIASASGSTPAAASRRSSCPASTMQAWIAGTRKSIMVTPSPTWRTPRTHPAVERWRIRPASGISAHPARLSAGTRTRKAIVSRIVPAATSDMTIRAVRRRTPRRGAGNSCASRVKASPPPTVGSARQNASSATVTPSQIGCEAAGHDRVTAPITRSPPARQSDQVASARITPSTATPSHTPRATSGTGSRWPSRMRIHRMVIDAMARTAASSVVVTSWPRTSSPTAAVSRWAKWSPTTTLASAARSSRSVRTAAAPIRCPRRPKARSTRPGRPPGRSSPQLATSRCRA